MNHLAPRLLAVLLLALVGLVGCADDDDDGDLAAYCALSAELDAQEDFPSDEQLDELRDLAPAEIEDEVDLATDRISEDGEAAFEDPEVNAAIEEIEAYEADACDRDDVDVDVDDDDDTTTTTEDDVTTTTEDDDTTTTTVDDTTSTTG